jgi:hypothetical protein
MSRFKSEEAASPTPICHSETAESPKYLPFFPSWLQGMVGQWVAIANPDQSPVQPAGMHRTIGYNLFTCARIAHLRGPVVLSQSGCVPQCRRLSCFVTASLSSKTALQLFLGPRVLPGTTGPQGSCLVALVFDPCYRLYAWLFCLPTYGWRNNFPEPPINACFGKLFAPFGPRHKNVSPCVATISAIRGRRPSHEYLSTRRESVEKYSAFPGGP